MLQVFSILCAISGVQNFILIFLSSELILYVLYLVLSAYKLEAYKRCDLYKALICGLLSRFVCHVDSLSLR